MTNPLNNPLNLSPQQAAVYRPKYRQRYGSGSYELDGTPDVRPNAFAGVMSPIHALEAWQKSIADDAKRQAPRWRDEALQTLRIYFAPLPNPGWKGFFLQACRAWEAVLPGKLQFVEVFQPDSADIRVLWTDVPVSGREFEVGHTDRVLHGGYWIRQVDVTLLTSPVIDQHLAPAAVSQRLFATMLHELGHALGLEHSQHRRDVMHHQGWRNQALSVNDVRAVQALYASGSRARVWEY